ncbi:rnase h [Holotrichia oblita]|uniref:Rnase h n=1 Tax=Holotrichia oblita TaxID=644536 RepID=A0ACB9SX89_HOLOL|nr:rnase h [Holotrichia oblita]
MNAKAVTNRRIHVMFDSQATLKALISRKASSRLVTECLDELVELWNRNKVCLTWIPGHQGIDDNSRADELAKRGSEMNIYGPEPFLGFTRQTTQRYIGDWVRTKQQPCILLLGVSSAPAGIRERDCIPSPDCHRSGPICVIDEYGATRTFEHQCMADLASCRKGTWNLMSTFVAYNQSTGYPLEVRQPILLEVPPEAVGEFREPQVDS